MSVTITRTIPDLGRLPLATRADMREAGLLAIELIRRRTLRGQDANGQPFQRYSTGYAVRKGNELGTVVPNLQVSGAMLSALQIVDLTDEKVSIGFA